MAISFALLLLVTGASLLVGFAFRGSCCVYEILQDLWRRRNSSANSGESHAQATDVGSFEHLRFTAKLKDYIGPIVTVIGLVSGAVIVALSIVVAQVGSDWYRLPDEFKFRTFTEPAAEIFLFLLFGVSGLIHCIAFVSIPDRFGKLRDTVAASIFLLVVFLVISLALLPEPIFRSLEMATR